jgi:hypothetical protein
VRTVDLVPYYSTEPGREVDFVTGDPDTGEARQLVQAYADLTGPGTRERQVRG